MNITDVNQTFLNREPILGVRFSHNDLIRIAAGVHAGGVGSLVAVLALEPEPLFVVELESGLDAQVLQSEIVRQL